MEPTTTKPQTHETKDTTTYPPLHTVPPTAPHTHTVILLHGTSTTGPSFASTFLTFPIPLTTSTTSTLPQLFPSVKFVFPTGKVRPSTVFGGKLLNAWFDITTFSDRTVGEDKQVEGLRESCSYLARVVREQVKEVGSAEKVVLGGFSQGCAMSVFLLLSGELDGLGGFGGYVGMSGWLPFRRQIDEAISGASTATALTKAEEKGVEGKRDAIAYVRGLLDLAPLAGDENETPENVGEALGTHMFFGHGGSDEKVKLRWAKEMRDTLGSLGCEVLLTRYEGLGHWYGCAEMQDLVAFLKGCGMERAEVTELQEGTQNRYER